MSAYPVDLSNVLENAWDSNRQGIEPPPVLPPKANLIQLLDSAYHASFLTEEGRNLRFRIAVMPEHSPKTKSHFGELFQGAKVPFTNPRVLNTNEIRRLAPATDFTQTIICVELRKQKGKMIWVVWGLLDTGTTWWDYLKEGTVDGLVPPNVLTITSVEPGNLTISREGRVVVVLRNGSISTPGDSLLYAGALFEFFKPAINQLKEDVSKRVRNHAKLIDEYDDRSAISLYIGFIEKILFYTQQKRHGGTFLFIPDTVDPTDTRLADRIKIKYSTAYYHIWENLILAAELDRIYFHLKYEETQNGKLKETNNQWRIVEDTRDGMEDFERQVRDGAKFIASLTGVDGAVVITDKFRVYGFGAEVIATSPSLNEVKIAADNAGRKGAGQNIETYGTRHRSAFRFCSSYENSVAFVISQDSGLKAIKRIGSDVIMWGDANISNQSV